MMTILSNWFKFSTRQIFRKPVFAVNHPNSQNNRTYADKPKTDVNKAKHVQVQGTENEERVRVRRTRPADVPRVLRFVREHACSAWPSIVTPPSPSNLVLCDYVARALAQGHSMLAEQQESRHSWSHIRGLALGMAVCPWDAKMIERWAQCIKCHRSRCLLQFTAHCLGAPGLHHKYGVHKILQVIMMVPQNSPKSSEIAKILTKNVIERGQEVGFSVLRFDVTNEAVAKVLEDLKLKKECQVMYSPLPGALQQNTNVDSPQPNSEPELSNRETIERAPTGQEDANFITVYTALTQKKIG